MEGKIALSGQNYLLFWLFFWLAEVSTSPKMRRILDWFSIVPGPFRVSGFLWHHSKLVSQFVFGIL